ncbi:MAG TPA: WbqC family protein [Bacteroidales bacterium]|nr:WbqC family protein [Bacteroidales bacterium]
MKAAIMQPTYLPWIGYFSLINQVDYFIFLDNVQFDKRSWQQRNRIKTKNGLMWLTVPVDVKNKFFQKIYEASISDINFYETHLKTMYYNYAKSNYFNEIYVILNEVYLKKHKSLSELNIELIKTISQFIGIKANFIKASELNINEKRSKLLSSICECLNVNVYVSPLGSKDYLVEEKDEFLNKNIMIEFQNYEHPEYNQLFPPFISYASVIDLMFNEGKNSLEIIKKGEKKNFSIFEL